MGCTSLQLPASFNHSDPRALGRYCRSTGRATYQGNRRRRPAAFVRTLVSTLLCFCICGQFTAAHAQEASVEPPPKPIALPGKLSCQALQTAGLHDYAGAPEHYEPSTFFESRFDLRINRVLTRHLAEREPGVAEATPDLYLTLTPRNASSIELRCRQVQGRGGEFGYSCTNTPPSELLLINPNTMRFTRSSIGGWVFADSDAAERADDQAATLGDDSLFVEFGTCE